MATKQLVDLSEALVSADDDIYHLQNSGGFNKKITKANMLGDIQSEVDANTSQVATNTSDIEDLRGRNPSNQTDVNYQLVASDMDAGEVWMNNAGANTVTIPLQTTESFTTGTMIVMQEGIGQTTIQAVVGVTLNGVDGGSCTINTQYSGASLTKRADNTWVIAGSISTVA